MTIVPPGVAWNAAQDVRPIGGVTRTPSEETERSVRGTATRNTFSFSFQVPLTPVRRSIAVVSRSGTAAAIAADTAKREAPQRTENFITPSLTVNG